MSSNTRFRIQFDARFAPARREFAVIATVHGRSFLVFYFAVEFPQLLETPRGPGDCGSRGPPFDPERRYHRRQTAAPAFRVFPRAVKLLTALTFAITV